MARTIGKKNIAIVKKLTREEIEIQTDPISKETNFVSVEDNVIEKLDVSMWDIWESADSEIRRIIFDVIMEKQNELS